MRWTEERRQDRGRHRGAQQRKSGTHRRDRRGLGEDVGECFDPAEAIAGLFAVMLLMLLTRRLYDARTAILSGVILATSFSFVFFSRHASADVETITGELAALYLFHRNQDRAGGLWVVGLWLVMAATSLTKGLLGFVLPLLMIGTYSSRGRVYMMRLRVR